MAKSQKRYSHFILAQIVFLACSSSLEFYFLQEGFFVEMSLNEDLEKESPQPTLWELCISGDVEGVEEAVRRGDQVHLDKPTCLIIRLLFGFVSDSRKK